MASRGAEASPPLLSCMASAARSSAESPEVFFNASLIFACTFMPSRPTNGSGMNLSSVSAG
jgi:hypothetical protein